MTDTNAVKIVYWVHGLRYEHNVSRHLIDQIDTMTINQDGTISFAPIKVTAQILKESP